MVYIYNIDISSYSDYIDIYGVYIYESYICCTVTVSWTF